MRLATTKSLIAFDDQASQDKIKTAFFPAAFLEQYEIFAILGKVCLEF